MDWQILVSSVACAGNLAFALVLWLRRDRGNIAAPLALLFFDAFAWTFAELAYKLTGVVEWHWIDHAFSSWLPVLTLQVIVGFVGRTKALRGALRAMYVLTVLIAAIAASDWWWRLLLVNAVGCTLFCCVLLVQHRRRTQDVVERRRITGLLLTLLLGGLLTTTDLWVDLVSWPRLSNVGMLVTLSLMAVCVLRLRLLGRDVPGLLVSYAVVGSVLFCAAGLVLVRSLPSRGAILALLLLSALAIGLALTREASRARLAERERLEKLVALGRFSEQLAHDLRNPLAALKGAIQFLMVERDSGRSLDDQAQFLGLMLEQVERTSRVVEAYQRIANVQPIMVETSLNELVEGVLGMQRFAPSSRIEVREARLEPSLPACELDSELMQTTLENLLRNAFEAMPGGGCITVETAVALGSDQAPGVSLSVTDEGQGMDARVLERATDQFFTTKATGSGLGLSFVERVARAHHGHLELRSEVGQGTTVRLWMPLRGMC